METPTFPTTLEKIQKSLKNTGGGIYAVGWITIVANIGLYLMGRFDTSFAASGFPVPDLSGVFIMILASSIFIILGNRLRKSLDKNSQLYLVILLAVSILIAVFILATGGRVGIILGVIVAYLIYSLISIHRAMKDEAFKAALTSPEYT